VKQPKEGRPSAPGSRFDRTEKTFNSKERKTSWAEMTTSMNRLRRLMRLYNIIAVI
jgi:hypothetical protein